MEVTVDWINLIHLQPASLDSISSTILQSHRHGFAVERSHSANQTTRFVRNVEESRVAVIQNHLKPNDPGTDYFGKCDLSQCLSQD